MNKIEVIKSYFIDSKIKFRSLNKSTAKKLLEFAFSHKEGSTITVNGVTYTFIHESYNYKHSCFSVYYTGRNRLYRISDHWSASQRGFISNTKRYYVDDKKSMGIGKVAKCWWTLEGEDNSFAINKTSVPMCHWTESMVEGGYAPLTKIHLR